MTASHYDSVGDVDPRVGEHLLDVLAGDGIAAYLQPSTDLHPITRTTSLPARPIDRLFVDREHVAAARDYVRQVTADQTHAPEAVEEPPAVDGETGDAAPPAADAARPRRDPKRRPTGGRRRTDQPPPVSPPSVSSPGEGRDVESAWAEIVAGYHLTAEPQATPRPKADGVVLGEPRFLPRIDPHADRPDPHDPDSTHEPGSDVRARRRAEPTEPSLLDALDTFGAHLPDEDDEGYTPPPAPPLPRISSAAALGVAAIVGGLLLFVWPDLLPMAHNAVLVLAFGLIVAGFGTLIWRLRPDDDDEDDDFDDGARI